MTSIPNPSPLAPRARVAAGGQATRGRRALTAASLLAASLALVASPGCGGGGPDGRMAVSGTVTLNGAPLNDASIEFVPTSGGPSTFGGATIIDGEYEIRADRGLAPGDYRVQISMAGSAKEPEMEAAPGDSLAYQPAPDLIPAKYNSESTLTARVEAGGENRFDFQLTK